MYKIEGGERERERVPAELADLGAEVPFLLSQSSAELEHQLLRLWPAASPSPCPCPWPTPTRT